MRSLSATAKKLAYIPLVLSIAGLSSVAKSAPVANFGENLLPLQQSFHQNKLHILQIGGSHTAKDYFTEQLRKRLQSDIGDGGVGFIYPTPLKGHGNSRHGYRSVWAVNQAKNSSHKDNYPLGGIYAYSNNNQKDLQITSQYYNGDIQDARIIIHAKQGQLINISNKLGNKTLSLENNGWQSVFVPIKFPVSFKAEKGVKIGGFFLQKPDGGVVSSMGAVGGSPKDWSGSTIGLRDSRADLIILSYGTKEALERGSNIAKSMTRIINDVRRELPNAVILIIGTPEVLSSTSGSCGVRGKSLNSIQAQLLAVAKQNQTLYWDWQTAMGGRCSAKKWQKKGLMAKNGVEFSKKGYQVSADNLYTNLSKLIKSQSYGNKTQRRIGVSAHGQQKYTGMDVNTRPLPSKKAPKKICDTNGICITVY